jgi:hypothetical protein
MRALVGVLAIAVVTVPAIGCTRNPERPGEAQVSTPAPDLGSAPTVPPAAVGGEPLGPAPVIAPWKLGRKANAP